MSLLASVFAAILLSLCWHVSVEGVYVEIPVQVAVSGDDYSSFGTINGDLQENVSYAAFLCWTWILICLTWSDDLGSGRSRSDA